MSNKLDPKQIIMLNNEVTKAMLTAHILCEMAESSL